MNKSSRRRFLATTGAGAAAVGAATVIPTSLAGAQEHHGHLDSSDFDADAGANLADSPLIACVGDLASGEVTVINGHHERTVTDQDLAQRIARLTRKEG